jgi:hypothetical protein
MAKLQSATAPPPTEEFAKLGDYLGKVLIMEPTEETTIDTSYGPDSPVTKVVAMAYDESKKKIETLGDQLVFWRAVRSQLHDAIESGSVVVGRLVKNGRRFELDEVDSHVLEAIDKLLQ